jgi:anaerobic selenocysteine-containing dehydrogenase
MRVANARGSFVAVADVSDRVRPGVVASTKGRWPGRSKGGATINASTSATRTWAAAPRYHDNRVEVERAAHERPV